MTDAPVHAATIADPDARPITDEEFARAKQIPRLKIIRRALGLKQQQFAARYQIPLGTLRDWERGGRQPDQAAHAYLRAIAGDSAAVHRACTPHPASGVKLGHAAIPPDRCHNPCCAIGRSRSLKMVGCLQPTIFKPREPAK